jgi:nucleoid-associated protein YgaU
MFFKGSRYEFVATAFHTDASGHAIQYKCIRYIAPAPASATYIVQQGDRLDNLAQKYYRDSERFWRICDANLATWPDDLLVTGATLGIPPSAG